MNEIHRRGLFYVTNERARGVYSVWRDAPANITRPIYIDTFKGRNAAQRAREACADCADAEDRKASR